MMGFVHGAAIQPRKKYYSHETSKRRSQVLPRDVEGEEEEEEERYLET
jgi:hypothetical protein